MARLDRFWCDCCEDHNLWDESQTDGLFECRVCGHTQTLTDLEAEAEEERRDDAAWRQEIAMEAGMAFGCQGYNDAMGY